MSFRGVPNRAPQGNSQVHAKVEHTPEGWRTVFYRRGTEVFALSRYYMQKDKCVEATESFLEKIQLQKVWREF
jgi:hypothetical protein